MEWGWWVQGGCGSVADAFAQAGGNFIDTADNYTEGTAERYVGDLIATERDRWVLATKYTLSRDPSDPNGAGNHRKSLVHALDASLKRLNTDHVDVLWVHIWDFLTPIEEVMRALDDQVRAGKVLYLGVSDTPAWIIAHANAIAAQHGWTPFVAAQAQYSLVERTVEREVAPMAQALDLAARLEPARHGRLTGKYDADAAEPSDDARLSRPDTAGAALLTERNFGIARVVREVASELDASPAQVALAWLLGRPRVVLPIVGARKESQIRDNLGALEIELSSGQLARLDAVSAIDLGFPQAFINGVRRNPCVLGDAHDRIDDHRADRSGLPLASSVPPASDEVEPVG